jgi:hypothetical protein
VTNGSMIWTLLCIAADVDAKEVTHIAGEDNKQCDRLSRLWDVGKNLHNGVGGGGGHGSEGRGSGRDGYGPERKGDSSVMRPQGEAQFGESVYLFLDEGERRYRHVHVQTQPHTTTLIRQ